MKKKSIIALLISLSLVMTMFLASCSSTPKTLEDYISGDENAQNQIQEAADASGLAVEIKGNDVIYTYDLSSFDGMNEELAKSDQMVGSLESALSSVEGSFTSLCSQLEEESKIEGVQIIVNYSFGDEVLVTKTFNKDGTVG